MSPQQFLQEALKSGMFIFLDSDLKIDNPQSDGRHRSRQDRATRLEDERRRRRAGGDARRRLCQLFQPQRALLQGDPAGAAALPAQSAAVARLLHPHRRRFARPAVDHRAASRRKTVPESLNHFQQLNGATIQGVAMPGVAQGDALAYLQDLPQTSAAAGLFGRLRRLDPAVHAGDPAASSPHSASR